jgi:hypothetical protein
MRTIGVREFKESLDACLERPHRSVFGAVRWPDDWRLARATSKEMRALHRRARCPIRRQP